MNKGIEMNRDIYDINTLIASVRTGSRPKYLFFWGHRPRQDGQIGKQCFSQWWPSSFAVNGINYRTAEHYMMAEKARLFNDQVCFDKILESRHPGEAKKLGREIKHFNESSWVQKRFEIVVQGNLAKFSQNEELKTFLVNTKKRVLVEASPADKIWGIGLAEDNPHTQNPEEWEGPNLLGFALMKVRDKLTEK